MNVQPILTVEVRSEQDVVIVRQRARQIAGQLGFPSHEQTGIATAVSELARNAFRYAGGGRTEFSIRLNERPQVLIIRISDGGPGIHDLDAVLGGRYVSETGMGLGIIGSQRLSDEFDLQSTNAGTTITLGKRLPRRAAPITLPMLATLSDELARNGPRTPLDELQQQNRELMLAMDTLRLRQAEVERLNAELNETNRGVVALYAELDDRAEALRKASEYKSRFLSDMTHELRTPLNAVVSLSRLLIDRVDGELTSEQERQVTLIHRSASSLGDMVDDLLDLAKIEAGKTEIQPQFFGVADTLAALRGIFRPLLREGGAQLIIAEPENLDVMCSDERKLSQILRNLVSNALKFTESGSVTVNARAGGEGVAVFTVIDTGIGIAPDNIERVFQDFTQIDSRVQRNLRGTGLGLPLTRKLARLLGGDVTVTSALGVGTTFTVTLPANLQICGDTVPTLDPVRGSL